MRAPVLFVVVLALGCTVRAPSSRRDAGSVGDTSPAPRDAFEPRPDPVTRTLYGVGVPDDVADLFAAAPVVSDMLRAARVVYPLTGAVMPRNVHPADVQWVNAEIADLVRIRLTNATVDITVYVRDDGAHHYLVEAEAWRSLAHGDPGQPSLIAVDRLGDGSLHPGTPVSVTFARPIIAGAMYFWSILDPDSADPDARVVRVDDGSAERVEFMPTPNPVGGHRCIGCHTVSPSGRYLSGSLNSTGGGVWDLTRDLTGEDPPTAFPVDTRTSPQWHFSSFAPDEARIIAGMRDTFTPLRLYDARTGASIPATGLPSRGTMPAWSPDGASIAYVTSSALPALGGAGVQADLAVLPVVGPSEFGESVTIHRGDSLPGGVVDGYPSWSPDSRRIAFGHGTSAELASEGRLFLVDRSGERLVELSNASSDASAFVPVFSPFAQGGYYWIAFLSRRPYGNAEAGTAGAPHDQIWVTAVRADAGPSEDPSSVPYWLPGQSVGEHNVWAYWAARSCRGAGTACGYDGDCCSDYCVPDSSECAPPRSCRALGASCDADADCCGGGGATATCVANACVEDVF